MKETASPRAIKSTRLHLSMEAEDALRMIKEEFQDNPRSMDYFYGLYHKTYGESGYGGSDKKYIGVTCVHVPEELIYAAGAVPIRLCDGSHSYERIGAEFTSAKTCSLVNATIGAMHINAEEYRNKFKAIVIPVTCDQKKKSISILREEGFDIWPLEIPSDKESDNSRHFWRVAVHDFTVKLMKLTGRKITKKEIKNAIAKLNKARREFRRLTNLRQSNPSPILGKDVFLVANSYFFDDIDKWTSALMKLNDELERRIQADFAAGNKKAPRILFAGSPPIFPNLKIPLLIEELGGEIVADEVCSSYRLLSDAVSFEEDNYYDLIPAIADRYLKPCVCPIFTSCDDRIRKLLDTVKSAKVDGVVYQSFSGCQLFSLEHHHVSDALKKEDIPMLYIESDYGPEDTGQISTRVEAFLESIQARKRRR